MHVYIIKACVKGPYKDYKQYMAAPSASIFSLAATTPKDVTITMCDETVDMAVDFNSAADIVAIFFSTPDAYRAYQIAGTFKAQGKTIVFGGLHSTFNSHEALAHADSVLIGECEGIWESLLSDYQQGELKKTYQRETAVDLNALNPYPTDLIPLDQYNYVWSVLVSRGCTNSCSFCLVHQFFDTMRYRKIAHVVDEIKASGAKIIELHADHLIADRAYAKALFEALIPLNISWVAETTIDIADDEELLALAAKSGLVYLLVGLETPNHSELKGQGKGFIKPEKVKQQIKKIHQYGILVDSGLLFGFAGQTADIFDTCIEFVNDIDLDVPHGIIPIPFPGSKLYKDLAEQGRITSRDWAKYDGRHLVFEHDALSEQQIFDGIAYFEDNVYNLKRAVRYYKWQLKMALKAIL